MGYMRDSRGVRLDRNVVSMSPIPPTTFDLASMVDAPVGAWQAAVTITSDANGSPLANSTLLSPHSDILRYSCPTVSYGSDVYRLPKGAHYTGAPTPNTGNSPMRVEFDHYGREFQITHSARAASRYRLWVGVDGGPLTPNSLTLNALPTSDNTVRHLHVDFGSVAHRRIMFETVDLWFAGVRHAVTDMVFPASTPPRPFVALVSDSYGVGAGGTGSSSTAYGFATTLGRLLNWDVWQTAAKGSTGFLATTSGLKYRDRLSNDVYPYAPDAVILQGSINDRDFNDAALQTEVVTTIEDVRTHLPNTPIILTGHLYCGLETAAMTGKHAVWSAAASAAADSRPQYVPTNLPAAWWSGTGRVGTTAGNGTGDVFMSSDGVHPTDAGHTYNAKRLADVLRSLAGMAI